MPTICLRPTTLRLVSTIALSIVLFASASSAEVGFQLNSSPTAGTMAGTVSFANLGDLTPTALSFSNDAECVYNFADPQLIPTEATWSGNQLIGLSLFIRDDSPPCGDFTTLIMVPSGTYTNGVHGAGTYAFAPSANVPGLSTPGLVCLLLLVLSLGSWLAVKRRSALGRI